MFWLVTGPILIASLTEMEEAISQNIGVSKEFEIMQDCADKEAVVDTTLLRTANESTLEEILTTRNLAIAALGFIGLECFCGMCGLCCVFCSGFLNCSKRLELCKELIFFLSLTSKG